MDGREECAVGRYVSPYGLQSYGRTTSGSLYGCAAVSLDSTGVSDVVETYFGDTG